jgi:DNA-binding GntR family transcriptional regulator
MSRYALGLVPARIAVVLQEHEELIATIDAHDEAAFAAKLRAHLDGTHRR